MTPTIDIEVFGAGHWAGLPFTTKHLDRMVANFPKVSHAIKPMVKLGHDSKQMLAQQKDGQPALGWVQGIRRDGQKLIATVADMPELLRDLIKTRRYDRISAEMFPHFEDTNAERNLKTGAHGPVLTAISLLGADAPEVSTLESLHKMLATSADDVVVEYAAPADETISVTACEEPAPMLGDVRLDSAQTPPRETVSMADKNADAGKAEQKVDVDALVAAKLAEMRAELDAANTAKFGEVEAQVATLKAANERLQAESNAHKARALFAEADQFVTRHQDRGAYRITPGMAPAVKALFCRLGTDLTVKGEDAKLVFADKKTEASDRDLLVALIEALPAVKLGEVSLKGDEPKAGDPTDPAVFAEHVKATAEKHSLELPKDYDKAVRLTLSENPDIAKAYRRQA